MSYTVKLTDHSKRRGAMSIDATTLDGAVEGAKRLAAHYGAPVNIYHDGVGTSPDVTVAYVSSRGAVRYLFAAKNAK